MAACPDYGAGLGFNRDLRLVGTAPARVSRDGRDCTGAPRNDAGPGYSEDSREESRHTKEKRETAVSRCDLQ